MAKAARQTERVKVPTEVRADSAGRIGLGKAMSGKLFQALAQPNGNIVLVPARVIPEREAWIFENPERLAALDAAMAESKAGKTSSITLDELEDL
jgi:hypothetical protein